MLYGSLQVWLGRNSYDQPQKQGFCRARLCPDEFSDQRTAELLTQSSAGSARPLAELQRALQFDTASASNWANLGEAEMNAHHRNRASYCYERALAAGPGNPSILFRAANFELQTGDESDAIKYLSAILRNPDLASYYESAFLTYARMRLPLSEILNRGIPKLVTAAEPFLDFWISDNRSAEAFKTWQWMIAYGLATDKGAGDYVSFLLRSKQTEAAADQWEQYNQTANPAYRVSNWIFNGGFESDPKPSPFDWHIESVRDVDASRVTETAFEGQNALRLVFVGKENVDYHEIFEESVISAGVWRLRAAIKLEAITSDQGIELRVFDVEHPQLLDVHTEPLTGTTNWAQVEKVFRVGPDTKLVRVEIVRRRSVRYEGKIQGTAWIDSVELTPGH